MRATLGGRILWRTETVICRCGQEFQIQCGNKGQRPRRCPACRRVDVHAPQSTKAPVLSGRREGKAFILEVRVYGAKEAARVAAKIHKEVLGL